MKEQYVIERHNGRNWVETNCVNTKTEAFDMLGSYYSRPLPDANEYRIVKLERTEIAWLDIREPRNIAKHDAQSVTPFDPMAGAYM